MGMCSNCKTTNVKTYAPYGLCAPCQTARGIKKLNRSMLSLVAILSAIGFVTAQDFKPKTSSEIFHDLQRLNFLGNVLYVAAHPDDENTRLISYFTHKTHANTAYLSLTRGDGGQNLIGTEIRELLGVLRTQELLAARGVDGGQQFFTRANDFGYSKTPQETLQIWNKDTVLADIVRRIRAFRPDIIINRFDHRTPGTTHGHHTSSAILSMEAFDLAANPEAYPEQLNELDTWQPSRIFFNTSWWFYGSQENFKKASKNGLINLDVGVFYPSLGKSNNEIASLASSKHLCQGFGRLNGRGEEIEYLELLKGAILENQDVFQGINTTWTRISKGSKIQAILRPIEENFDFKNPGIHLPDLLQAFTLIQQIDDPLWREKKTEQIVNLIKEISGLYLAFETDTAFATPGEKINTKLKLLARNNSLFSLEKVQIKGAKVFTSIVEKPLELNKNQTISVLLEIQETTPLSNPYWLNQSHSSGMYQVEDQSLIGLPESPPAVSAEILLNVGDIQIPFALPLVYRYAKPDKGELWERFKVVPPISVSLSNDVVLFSDESTKEVVVNVKSFAPNQKGELRLHLPKEWKVEPLTQSFNLDQEGKQVSLKFIVSPPEEATETIATIKAKVNAQSYTKNLVSIVYDHIPSQRVLVNAESKFVRLDLKKRGEHLGYLMGAGDKVPESLKAIGYNVEQIEPSKITTSALKKYEAVILGVRALNVIEGLTLKKQELLDYVSQGGVLISQYNTANRRGNNEISIAPFPLTNSSDRVTEENAVVKLLQPNHPVLSFPNKITEKDFEGWVQERGLYFPNRWDKSYIPILEMNDQFESAKKGSLLLAPLGDGYFVYTGLSFFRELPAGVPGAYRLIANMISLGANSSSSNTLEKH
jgi:LmbE family N-acetylglucosaminyl deacetylase